MIETELFLIICFFMPGVLVGSTLTFLFVMNRLEKWTNGEIKKYGSFREFFENIKKHAQ